MGETASKILLFREQLRVGGETNSVSILKAERKAAGCHVLPILEREDRVGGML